MGDAVETEKALNISKHLAKLIKDSESAISQLHKVKEELLTFYEFAADDYLSGKQFVGNATLEKMIAAYGNGMTHLGDISSEMSAVAGIRNENHEVFRQNLNNFVAGRGKSFDEIRKMFD